MGQILSFPVSRKDILRVARADLSPSLVAINEDVIRSLNWPTSIGDPMLIELDGAKGSAPFAALTFLVAMDSLNYRFWSLDGQNGFARYLHGGKTGAKALWAAFDQGWGNHLDCSLFIRELTTKGLHGVFGNIPDPASRELVLRDVLRPDVLPALCAEISDDILATRKATVRHASYLAQYFPYAFNDPYLKKAQLAIAMFAGYLHGKGIGIDVSDLTAFADYQVPRVLRALGILEYAAPVATAVDEQRLIAANSQEERAIRAATILACETIANHLGCTAANVDNLLWLSQDVAGDSRFHLTETIWY